MEKPGLFTREPVYDYHSVIEYIEKKYHIDTRDYASKFGKDGHFEKWLKIVGEEKPNYPNSPNGKYQVRKGNKMVEITKEEYDSRFVVIHEQYKRYQEWVKDNPEPPYLDFWHWLLDYDFCDVHNGSTEVLHVKELLSDDSNPEWVRQILAYIYCEYNEDTMMMIVEW